jgi:hypothetical protein
MSGELGSMVEHVVITHKWVDEKTQLGNILEWRLKDDGKYKLEKAKPAQG